MILFKHVAAPFEGSNGSLSLRQEFVDASRALVNAFGPYLGAFAFALCFQLATAQGNELPGDGVPVEGSTGNGTVTPPPSTSTSTTDSPTPTTVAMLTTLTTALLAESSQVLSAAAIVGIGAGAVVALLAIILIAVMVKRHNRAHARVAPEPPLSAPDQFRAAVQDLLTFCGDKEAFSMLNESLLREKSPQAFARYGEHNLSQQDVPLQFMAVVKHQIPQPPQADTPAPALTPDQTTLLGLCNAVVEAHAALDSLGLEPRFDAKHIAPQRAMASATTVLYCALIDRQALVLGQHDQDLLRDMKSLCTKMIEFKDRLNHGSTEGDVFTVYSLDKQSLNTLLGEVNAFFEAYQPAALGPEVVAAIANFREAYKALPRQSQDYGARLCAFMNNPGFASQDMTAYCGQRLSFHPTQEAQHGFWFGEGKAFDLLMSLRSDKAGLDRPSRFRAPVYAHQARLDALERLYRQFKALPEFDSLPRRATPLQGMARDLFEGLLECFGTDPAASLTFLTSASALLARRVELEANPNLLAAEGRAIFAHSQCPATLKATWQEFVDMLRNAGFSCALQLVAHLSVEADSPDWVRSLKPVCVRLGDGVAPSQELTVDLWLSGEGKGFGYVGVRAAEMRRQLTTDQREVVALKKAYLELPVFENALEARDELTPVTPLQTTVRALFESLFHEFVFPTPSHGVSGADERLRAFLGRRREVEAEAKEGRLALVTQFLDEVKASLEPVPRARTATASRPPARLAAVDTRTASDNLKLKQCVADLERLIRPPQSRPTSSILRSGDRPVTVNAVGERATVPREDPSLPPPGADERAPQDSSV